MKQHCIEATKQLRQLLSEQNMSPKEIDAFINKAEQIFFDENGDIKYREIEIDPNFYDLFQRSYSHDSETETSIVDNGDSVSLISKRKKKAKQQKMSRKKNRKK